MINVSVKKKNGNQHSRQNLDQSQGEKCQKCHAWEGAVGNHGNKFSIYIPSPTLTSRHLITILAQYHWI